MNSLEALLAKELSSRKEQQQFRQRLSLQSSQSDTIKLNGQSLNNFSSNDYLGLANHTSTKLVVKQQIDDLGVGSGASHLVCGHHQVHQTLEEQLASFLQRDSAVTFSTGYMANMGILQSLARKGDLIIADKLNHASLIDGAKLSSAESVRYAHCDLNKLESRLKKQAAQKWVVTDSVFSMDGDIAPLDKIAALCKKYQAFLIVDDAHGIGVLGDNGRGSAEHFNLNQEQLPILMGTFGKALGGFGAFVTGAKELTDYLIQFARPYIYTTAIPAIIAAANLHNLKLIEQDSSFRLALQQNIKYFKQLCQKKGISLMPSDTGIQPVVINDTKRLMKISERLKQNGFLVGAIRPPTVPLNTDRLRVTLSATHTNQQISDLVEWLSV